MRHKTQFNLWLEPSTRTTLDELAAGRPINAVIETLIQQEAARRSGKIIEQAALPAIREIIDEKLRTAITQLRDYLHDDMQLELLDTLTQHIQGMKSDILKEMRAREQKSDDRLAALIVRSIREGGISRRMLYTVLSKEDPDLAMTAYEDAKAKVGKELASRIGEGAA